MSDRLRIRYKKTGKATYISHLDLMSCMKRSMLRAGIELSYSTGFNPHSYISVALPLQVGCASSCELLDFEPLDTTACDVFPEKINKYLPEGLEVIEIYRPERKFAEIAWLEMTCRFYYDKPQQAIRDKIIDCFSAESLQITKKTKSGFKQFDIAPYIRNTDVSGGEDIIVAALVSAQEPSITPADITNAMVVYGISAPDYVMFERIEMFDSDNNVFR